MNFLSNIKKFVASSRNKRGFIAASNLEKKTKNLNIKSEEYLQLAKRDNEEWKRKWFEVIN
tara:strand:- start:1095 stop:1277 length:183 start_codon:yes stop_codon:yes gene_type:complete